MLTNFCVKRRFTIILTGRLETFGWEVSPFRSPFAINFIILLIRRVFDVYILIFLIYSSRPQELIDSKRRSFFPSVRKFVTSG